ncbi:Dyp-type peroxidase [Kitasatospora sp. NPDC048296]|uniref:Dyp-type peroxidase n=1 Tax=Kitasatospora sp. NPDC048296 TaxID=3364048 RepID=UPI00371BFA5C
MTTAEGSPLQLDEIQGIVLRDRPSPYVGTYLLLRVDDPVAGRQMMGRLAELVDTAANWWQPTLPALLNVGLTYQGLEALEVSQASLSSFPEEFRQGMAARAETLFDTGDSAPAHWEPPFGTGQVHIMLSLLAADQESLAVVLERARQARAQLPGVQVVYRQDFYQLSTGRTSFGYKDGIGNPTIEGSGAASPPGDGTVLKAGEFVLGYPDQTGNLPPMPEPAELGRNGTFVAWRKLHTRVAAFRKYLHDNAAGPDEEALLAAKIVGRWQSGSPLTLAPEHDDPALGADDRRNNDFRYQEADPEGHICPRGAHARRCNPRDSEIIGDVHLHRMIRRGTNYGPRLPTGILDDDGADRGIVFVFIGAHLGRQFEFVKSQWLNDGNFAGLDREKDLLTGANDGTGIFTIPQRPIRRRLHGVERFVITRGGEYFFLPSIGALRWLAGLGA